MTRLQRIRTVLARLVASRPTPAEAARRTMWRQAVAAATVPVRHVVLICRRPDPATLRRLVAGQPGVRVSVLTVLRPTDEQRARIPAGVEVTRCPTTAARLRQLSGLERPQVIAESGLASSGQRTETFRALFALLSDGGRYALVAAPGRYPAGSVPATDEAECSRLLERLGRLDGDHRPEPDDTEALARSVTHVVEAPGGQLVAKRSDHQWKLRERATERLLTRRYGTGWGELLATKPAVTFTSCARGHGHGEGLRSLRTEISVPPRALRRYQDVTCYPRKRLRQGDFWLPDTFRNQRMRRLSHRVLESVSPELARLTPAHLDLPVRPLPGAFFYLDSEYPSHFGHVLTDVVALTWCWQPSRQRDPGVRPLVSLPPGRSALPEFQRQIFAALDIDPDRVEYIHADEAVQVERLYAGTPDWAMPRYAAPELADVWERIATRCANPDLAGSPRRLFVTRPPGGQRSCLNAAAVETFFEALDFTVLRPETLAFADQVAVFRDAEVVAGFVGSAMFGTAFGRPRTTLVLTGASYTALNEYLIAAVRGGDIHYFWSPSQIAHPTDSWSWEAFRSDFVFDLDRFAPEIVRIVASA